MTQTALVSVLRRIVRPVRVVEAAAPITPARALRQALTRAAERSVGLAVSVLGVTQDIAPLDELLSGIEDDQMLAVVADNAGPAGFMALDLQTRAAVVEVQTLGNVSTVGAAARRATTADMAMADPFLSLFLTELRQETQDTALDGWVGDRHLQGRFSDLREAGLALSNGDYRAVRMTLDLGAGGRQGLITLVLPMPAPPAPVHAMPPATGWSEALNDNVMAARTGVTAVLHRMHLPLRAVEGFTLGQVVPLPGVSVGSVRVETADAKLIGPARLGQMSGMRAVRLGPQRRAEMDETMALPAARD